MELQEVRAEIAQTEDQAAHQALKEKRLGVLPESERDRQRQRGANAGRTNRPAEPGTEGVGTVPLPSSGKTHLQQARSHDSLANLEVGEAQAS
ncbi:hypothetical protein D9M69_540630 [compost metagenome]